MISIVISSYKEDNFRNVSKSISETIGTDYEIIKMDNPDKYSMTEAYNKGLNMCIYDIVVFVHDDVVFNDMDWGKMLVAIFSSNGSIGLIGLAGSRCKTKAPSAWSWNESNLHYLIQYKEGKMIDDYVNSDRYLGKNKLYEVALLDGVFLCMDKRKGLKFDERISGFHEYDSSISLISISKGLKNYVCSYFSLSHYSYGNRNNSWLVCQDLFCDFYSIYLPAYTQQIEAKKAADLEIRNFKKFISYCDAFNNKKLALKYSIKFLHAEPFKLTPYKILFKLIFKKKTSFQ